MKTIAIVSRKGGAGKTALAVAASVKGKETAIIDLDEAIEAIKSYGVAIAPTRVGQRAAFVHSLTAGQTA